LQAPNAQQRREFLGFAEQIRHSAACDVEAKRSRHRFLRICVRNEAGRMLLHQAVQRGLLREVALGRS
jgi:hypothetical protein